MSPQQIDVCTHDGRPLPLDGDALAEALSSLLIEQKAEGAVSCVLADDTTLHRLNREYRGVDAPTDVLSFTLADGTDAFPGDAILGEIYISTSRARAQAEEAGRSLQEEIVHLAVHGALHLAGHEHDTEPGYRKMRVAEERTLRRWMERDAGNRRADNAEGV